ncbi:hypothetical protein OG216_47500 (plasmid) [Streptomycetaceae bacterium NBC_01309]
MIKHNVVEIYRDEHDGDDLTVYMDACTRVCFTCHRLTGEYAPCIAATLSAHQLAELEQAELEELEAAYEASTPARPYVDPVYLADEFDAAHEDEADEEASQAAAEFAEARRVAEQVERAARRLREWCAETDRHPAARTTAEAAVCLISADMCATDALKRARAARTLNEAHAARDSLNSACAHRRDYQRAARSAPNPRYLAARRAIRARTLAHAA